MTQSLVFYSVGTCISGGGGGGGGADKLPHQN